MGGDWVQTFLKIFSNLATVWRRPVSLLEFCLLAKSYPIYCCSTPSSSTSIVTIIITKAVFCHPKNKSLIITKHLALNTTTIEVVNAVKALRVIFSVHVKWKVNSILYKLFRAGCYDTFPEEVEILTYVAVFLSLINSCNLICGTVGTTNTKTIFVIHKKISHLTGDVAPRTYTQFLFKKTLCIAYY